ncbi:MAG: hypothetical protein ACON5H_03965 [Akkermansiaceae bacterium]
MSEKSSLQKLLAGDLPPTRTHSEARSVPHHPAIEDEDSDPQDGGSGNENLNTEDSRARTTGQTRYV